MSSNGCVIFACDRRTFSYDLLRHKMVIQMHTRCDPFWGLRRLQAYRTSSNAARWIVSNLAIEMFEGIF
jgi:hypothetical protein